MIPQRKHEYAMSISHMTEPELLRHSDELHEALENPEPLPEEQKTGLKEGIQSIFEAVLRREALTEMTMDELNQCIVTHEMEASTGRETMEREKTLEMEEHVWNAQVWEADARAEFMRRMTDIIQEAFMEESSDDSSNDSSEES